MADGEEAGRTHRIGDLFAALIGLAMATGASTELVRIDSKLYKRLRSCRYARTLMSEGTVVGDTCHTNVPTPHHGFEKDGQNTRIHMHIGIIKVFLLFIGVPDIRGITKHHS